MDFDQRSDQERESAYPYNDYYSTGGRYRPPRKPRNYGWLLAVLGAFLLCIAGGVVLNQHFWGQAEQNEPAAAEMTPNMLEAANNTPEETPAATASVQTEVLGSGTQLDVAKTEGETLTLQEIYKKVIPSVASITAVSGSSKSTGTGIIMSEDGYIITNYHVVNNAVSVEVLVTSGETYTATLVGGDETSDLMVLKIDAEKLSPAEFGSSDSMEVGDSVVAIGDPLGTELRGTMTDGIICGIQRDVRVEDRTMTLLQTNAALNSGNSGGPLVNMAGQVIGINTMKLSSAYTAVEGIGFAIPIATAKPIVDELVEKGYVSGRPAFGFSVQTLNTRVALFYNLPGKLCVGTVMPESDAGKKGIQDGDIILGIDGTRVSTMDEFNTIKNEFSAGDVVTLTIYRQGSEMDVDVELMDRADLD